MTSRIGFKMRSAIFSLGLLLLAACAAAVIWRSHQSAAALKLELAGLREAQSSVRDRSGKTKSFAPDHELEQLKRDHGEAVRLRSEISQLGASLQTESSKQQEPPQAASPPPPPPQPKQWRNLGRATPSVTFESVLWSANAGETENLAAMITFDPTGRALVEALFARLPEAMQRENRTPERAFAILLAARIPQTLSSANVMEQNTTGEGGTVRMQLRDVDGSEREANFNFVRDPDGWKLVVPTSVVRNYQKMLSSGTVAAPSK